MTSKAAEKTSIELEVPFHDVDLLGVVWHGHYYKYMELARTRLLRERALDAADLRELGHAFLVIETKCRHTFPLRYGDRARVDAWLKDTAHRLCIAYEIHNLTHGRRSARGRTVLVTTDAEGRMHLETPPRVRERLSGGGR